MLRTSERILLNSCASLEVQRMWLMFALQLFQLAQPCELVVIGSLGFTCSWGIDLTLQTPRKPPKAMLGAFTAMSRSKDPDHGSCSVISVRQ